MSTEEYGYDAKFGVRTGFLDSTFYRRRQPKEGESFEDFVVEMHREMLRAIERLQKEFPSTEIVASVDMRQPTPIIDYGKHDQSPDGVMADIKKAQTLAELTPYKLLAGQNKETYNAYNQRLKELSNGF